MGMIRAALIGSVATCGFIFPAAALSALIYRFPVPFAGYQSGAAAVPVVLAGVLFYGATLGGFIVLAVLGAIAGVIAHSVHRRVERSVVRVTVWLSLALACAAAFTLAILDHLIGPW